MSVVFVKTAKGQDEITQRSGDLTPRARRVLILVDGRRTVDELRDLVSADDLTHTLGALEELGLIEVKAQVRADGKPASADAALPPVTTFRALAPNPDPKELEMARHFMINTLKTFCGLYGPVTLMSTIHSAKSHQELRDVYGNWYHTIVDTRMGRRRAEDLRKDLLKVL